VDEEVIEVTFLANGSIDYSITNQTYLDEVNELLAPTISATQTVFNDPNLDIWQLFNFAIVSIYWIFLADFGQIAPTTYPYNQSAVWQGYPNFTSPTQYPPTNNIFYDENLFTHYGLYLFETVLPFVEKEYNIQVNLTGVTSTGPLNQQIEPIPMTFIRGYNCSQRQLKEWVSLLVTVIVADVTFLSTAYFCLIWLARRLEARRFFIKDNGISVLTPF
jgi:hypothetical protein